MRRRLFLYSLVITIPLMLGLDSWQATRYARLESQLRKLESEQRDWLESNKKLIAGIAILGSAERIERIALQELGLRKAKPESVLHVRVQRSKGGLDG
ncbi:MAG: cell division protein FtsL [Treponema sp. GWB1_62_6]|nr:MAG: cell division protein FtsL [Treponema sp. GWB1_62_6]OHE63933.1 MAG: cell division protein FtsL [Treponema sp. GWC1_61_84]OHE76694.1 MAG: cell division protein FtsL [Treponema sp. RIFOXYC1_FULL_61_9]HCM25255.1 cell division protein FtsL [Treponema sp.]